MDPNVYKLNDRSLTKILVKMAVNKTYRNKVRGLIKSYLGKTEALPELARIKISPRVKQQSLYIIGACELHPFVNTLKVLGFDDIYFSFEAGNNPNPDFELKNPASEFHKQKNYYFINAN